MGTRFSVIILAVLLQHVFYTSAERDNFQRHKKVHRSEQRSAIVSDTSDIGTTSTLLESDRVSHLAYHTYFPMFWYAPYFYLQHGLPVNGWTGKPPPPFRPSNKHPSRPKPKPNRPAWTPNPSRPLRPIRPKPSKPYPEDPHNPSHPIYDNKPSYFEPPIGEFIGDIDAAGTPTTTTEDESNLPLIDSLDYIILVPAGTSKLQALKKPKLVYKRPPLEAIDHQVENEEFEETEADIVANKRKPRPSMRPRPRPIKKPMQKIVPPQSQEVVVVDAEDSSNVITTNMDRKKTPRPNRKPRPSKRPTTTTEEPEEDIDDSVTVQVTGSQVASSDRKKKTETNSTKSNKIVAAPDENIQKLSDYVNSNESLGTEEELIVVKRIGR